MVVWPGDKIDHDQSVIAIESEIAAIDIPAPTAGTVQDVFVRPGHRIGIGDRILSMT